MAAGTTYSYRVEAYDAAGNSSAQSPAEAATTQSAGGGGQPAASSGGGCGLGMIRPGPPRSGSTGWFLLTLVWPLAVLGGRKIYNCCSA
ncbi:MAG: hypothetical protein HY208_03915 [Nitrospirae bacterium]|nr:hypothetical protein [Nitrospirota bacterium]